MSDDLSQHPLYQLYAVKDSGQREEFASGMVRDTAGGKIDYSLIRDGPMFKRWAVHLTQGAQKYNKRNWMKAEGLAELERFRESALRHFEEYDEALKRLILTGEWIPPEEDVVAAVFFNLNGAEYVREKLDSR